MKRTVLWFMKATTVLGLAIATTGSAEAGNIVLNGDFSSGAFMPGFTLSGDSSEAFITSGQLTGSTYQADLTTSGNNGFLMQSLATVIGQQYTFSFLLGSDNGDANSFSASLGGTTVYSVANLAPDLPTGMAPSMEYTATSTTTQLSFAFNDAPGDLYLTNISVSANSTAVPEPATVVTVGLGALMVSGYLWRKQLRQAAI